MEFVLPNGYGLAGYVPYSLEDQDFASQRKPSENEDEFWMHQALVRAMSQVGLAAPNPTVGCVLVKDGQLIAGGATEEFGGLHGEMVALGQVANKEDLIGATCYVTLEPCSHYGKQPPCVEQLIKSQISRCVIGLKDPYPDVNGQGIKKLREAGIEVKLGVLARALSAWHLPFLFRIHNKRPMIVGKWAQTLDGCLADDRGVSQWITGTKARLHTHFLRQRYDTIMVGVGTILHDIPSLNVRDSARKVNRSPIKIIYDPKGVLHEQDLPCQEKLKAKTFAGEKTIYAGPFKKGSWLSKLRGVSIVGIEKKLGPEFFQHVAVAYQNLTQKTLESVMVEGGARLLSSLISQDLFDAYHIFQRPSFLGKSRYSLERDLGHSYHALGDKLDLHLLSCQNLGQDLLIDAINYRTLKCLEDLGI